jgi:bacteriorhodopsin
VENLENLFTYTSVQHDIISHFLMLCLGAHVAGLVYFLTTKSFLAPHYRLSSALSAVVMVSTALLYFRVQLSWSQAFAWNGQLWQPSDSTFSNAYRYVNWSLTVPVLLTQLLLVLGITGAKFRRTWLGFAIGSMLMIWTGYVGQFYETTSLSQLLIWGAISSVFMVYICYLVGISIFPTSHAMPGITGKLMRWIFWLLIISWTLYPVAYLVPWFMPTAWGGVLRQVLFTVADVTSKVVYGVMLSRVALLRSAHEGYEPAHELLGLHAGNKPAM